MNEDYVFPHDWETIANGERGMALRDWFAGAALTALASGKVECNLDSFEIASKCYEIADQMLACRLQYHAPAKATADP